jgi:hypothetical protein
MFSTEVYGNLSIINIDVFEKVYMHFHYINNILCKNVYSEKVRKNLSLIANVVCIINSKSVKASNITLNI